MLAHLSLARLTRYIEPVELRRISLAPFKPAPFFLPFPRITDVARNERQPAEKHWLWRHPVLVLFGTILIGSLGSGLWEIGVKPSLTWISQAVLNVITLGSTSIKDSAYAAAALDQTAAPAAYLYLLVLAFLSAPLFVFVAKEFGFTPLQITMRVGQLSAAVDHPDDEATRQTRAGEIEKRRKVLIRYRRGLLVTFGVCVAFLIARALVHNQSLLI